MLSAGLTLRIPLLTFPELLIVLEAALVQLQIFLVTLDASGCSTNGAHQNTMHSAGEVSDQNRTAANLAKIQL